MMASLRGDEIMADQPVNKWIQSVFWFISALPSFGHIPKHSADDYVGRTSPLLGTVFAFWIVALGTIAMALIANGVISGMSWRGIDAALSVGYLITGVLYIAGFWMFFSREEQYPN
jgi:hypothetical protein